MANQSADTITDINDKLDKIIRLLAYNVVVPFESQKDKIMALYNAGLGSRDIAYIVGSTPHSVSQTISSAKKASKKRTAKKSTT